MSNPMRFLRPFVFVVFVVCCAIVASVAVWNLSIINSITSEDETTVKQIDTFLIFLGASGLVLIFPTIFFELLEQNIFLGKVWFELLWVGLYGLMYLVIVYFAILFVLAAVKHQEDKTIWKCSVRQFEWLHGRRTLKSNPASPSLLALPKFNAETPGPAVLSPPQMAEAQPPVILAPRPRPLAALRNAILSYRSGLSSDYEVEHDTVQQAIEPGKRQETAPATYPLPRPQLTVQTQTEAGKPTLPNVRPLPASPPPLGVWPRLDATTQPRIKRKLPQPIIAASPEPVAQPAPMTEMQKQKSKESSQPEAGPSRLGISPEPLPRIPSGSGSGRRRSSGRYQPEAQPLGLTLNALSEDEPVDSWSRPQQSQPLPLPQKSSTVARDSISSPVDPVALSAALSSLAEPSKKFGQGSSSKPSGVRGPRQSALGMIAGPSRRFS
ncbi:hypothetical protein CVT24_008925 [Panaeolus cyanescens]|uniref:Uncharacterized protein n=1 Tax=Panaeolus cyanescens TaxID=181874 RepID=A0A409VB13_9AGAR|nr:hypothetical protein CVT24_008925 [Panaeolus cyanescens]